MEIKRRHRHHRYGGLPVAWSHCKIRLNSSETLVLPPGSKPRSFSRAKKGVEAPAVIARDKALGFHAKRFGPRAAKAEVQRFKLYGGKQPFAAAASELTQRSNCQGAVSGCQLDANWFRLEVVKMNPVDVMWVGLGGGLGSALRWWLGLLVG